MIKISIVTPSINQPDLLEHTICPVLDQDYSPLEYLLIDCGMSDEVRTLVDSYAGNITIFPAEPGCAWQRAVNTGLAGANGSVLGWLMPGDCYLPGALLEVAGCVRKNPTAAAMAGSGEWCDETGLVVSRSVPREITVASLFAGLMNLLPEGPVLSPERPGKTAGHCGRRMEKALSLIFGSGLPGSFLFVQCRKCWGVHVDYSLEDRPLSIIGPLTLIPDLPEHFLVMNGDILCDLNYREFFDHHEQHGHDVTVSVFKRDAKIDKNNDQSLITEFIEKLHYHFDVSMGINCISRKVIEKLPKGEPRPPQSAAENTRRKRSF